MTIYEQSNKRYLEKWRRDKYAIEEKREKENVID